MMAKAAYWFTVTTTMREVTDQQLMNYMAAQSSDTLRALASNDPKAMAKAIADLQPVSVLDSAAFEGRVIW